MCRYCPAPPKHASLDLCGAHYMRWLRSGRPDLAAWDGQSPARTCVQCGREFAGRKQATCSDACAQERRREQQRESKRREWAADPAAAREKQRRRRRNNPGVYRALDARRRANADPGKRARLRAQAREAYARRQEALGRTVRARGKRLPRVRSPCAVCGAPLPARRLRYCCDACQRLARLAKVPRPDGAVFTGLEGMALASAPTAGKYRLPCAVCGAPFQSDASHAKYCSAACRRRSLTARRRKGPRTVVARCVVCGERFTASKVNATTCSAACRAEDKRRKMRIASRSPEARERQRLRRREVAAATHCLVCGCDLLPLLDLRRHRYTCSAACRAAARKQKNRRAYVARRNRK